LIGDFRSLLLKSPALVRFDDVTLADMGWNEEEELAQETIFGR
jgi:hypothetical protein